MSDMYYFYFYFLFGAALLLSAMGMWFTAVIPGIERWSKRFFLSFFFVFLLCDLSGFTDVYCTHNSIQGTAYFCVSLVECLLLSLPMPMLSVYLVHCSSEDVRSSRFLRVVAGLTAVYFVMLVSTTFIGSFSVVTPDGWYARGPLYPLVVLPLVAILLLNIAETICRRKRLSRKVFIGFIVALLPMTVAMIVQLFVDAFAFLDISYVISALVMYSFVLSDQIERDRLHQREIVQQQLEIANQRASIMVLQMRPHFIYNTMTSIYCLCAQDAELARKVIMDFTTYLRKNLTAIASAEPIPFSSELEHVHAYLAVEQALYEDSLFVEYDTPHTWFRIPPLTLQPIVENAVKHGRDLYAGPLHISIRTRKTDSASEIVVVDDGHGFDLPYDSEPHTAIENIRQRLEIMCGGQLAIAPNNGGGTVVTVTIPDRTVE